jgi:hypothetical protein
VARAVRRLRATPHQRDELITHLDERGAVGALLHVEVEELAVEGEGLVDVADLEGDVVDADQARALAHGTTRWLSPNSCQR